jgi:hypothetical protein
VRWPAYATACRLPIDRAEALRLVSDHLHLTDELPEGRTLNVDEWDSCFTITVSLPAPPVGADGIPLRPVEPGGGVTVLDKENGYFSFWPSWGSSHVVQRFAEAKAADEIDYLAEWPVPDR